MKELKDAVGNDLHIGDYICYTTRKRSSMTVHVAKIVGYVEDPDSFYYRFTLKVVTVGGVYQWNEDHTHFGLVDKAYKARLISNDTIVSLNPYTLTYEHKRLIDDFIKRDSLRLVRK